MLNLNKILFIKFISCKCVFFFIQYLCFFILYRKKKSKKNKDTTIEKINKGLEQEKVKEYHVPPTKAELAFMKQQEKLVKYFSYYLFYFLLA